MHCTRITWSPVRSVSTAILAAVCAGPLVARGAEEAPRGSAEAPPVPTAERIEEYAARGPKTILALQQFRRTSRIQLAGSGSATLLELSPRINAWLLLTLDLGRGDPPRAYHLENPEPGRQQVRLDQGFAQGLIITEGGRDSRCALWSNGSADPLEGARAARLPFAPLCDGRLLLRNPVTGHSTRLEQATDFLRDHVWGGEAIVGFVKQGLFQDAFRESGATAEATPCPAATAVSPPEARVSDDYRGQTLVPEHLGIDVAAPGRRLSLGCWYPVYGIDDVFLSAIRPEAVAADILTSHRDRVANLDSVEAGAVDYLVAFDLARFDLNFELGTDHPRLDWSERPRPPVRDDKLPGPDGFDSADPLVRTGMVSPALAARTVAAFAGGFKRIHGAFRYGELARKNNGSHFGFVSQGTVFSKLQPGLSTLFVLADGTVDIKTWTQADNRLLGVIRHARQNGVPIIESDPATGRSVPGALVARWGQGSWSGSAENKLRTLRAGACLLQTPDKRFLVNGYFSTATPSAMARVFQAYGCRDAMLLDINALEHTYLALYARRDGEVVVQHLIRDMNEVDKSAGDRLIPRFLGFPDNRDFFYLTRREASP